MIKLLKGDMGSINVDNETLDFMEIEFISDNFIVILSEISDISYFFEHHTEREWALARFVIGNVGAEIMEDAFKHYFVEVERNRTAFIVNFPSDIDLLGIKDIVRDFVTDFEEALSEICGLSVGFGISEIHNGVVELRECYDEALKALDYNIMIGTDNTIFFSELTFTNDYYYYP